MLRKVYLEDACIWYEKNPNSQPTLVNAFGCIDSIRRYLIDNKIIAPPRAWINKSGGYASVETRYPALGDRNPYSDSHNYGGLLSEYRGDGGEAGAVSRSHNKLVSHRRREGIQGGAGSSEGYDSGNDS